MRHVFYASELLILHRITSPILIIISNSPTLSGAQASSVQANSSRSDHRNYEVFRSSAIRDLWASKEDTKLVTEEDCRMAMILVALLAGGDYVPEGVGEFGELLDFASSWSLITRHARGKS